MNEFDEKSSDQAGAADDDMFTREVPSDEDQKERLGLGITDFVRKKLESTIDQVQTTGTLSRDALSYVIQQGDKGRKEVLRIVAQEVGDFLKHTDLSRELTKVLTGMKVDITASIAFKPADDGRSVKADLEHQVKMSTSPEDAAEEEAE